MSGVSGDSIPDSLRKTIQDIKEVTGNKHSDADVYTVLKDCNMDPNDTAQKLLYLDTFQEVKRKRDRRKVIVNNRGSNEYRPAPGMQRRGTRSGNHYPSNNSDGGKHVLQEKNHSRPKGRTSNSSMREETNKLSVAVRSMPNANGSTITFNGISNGVSSSQLIKDNVRDTTNSTKSDYGDKSSKLPSLRPVVLKQLPTLDPGPTPTPTPTNTSMIATRASPTVSGMYSSATDPVLVPSLNPRNPAAVGIIKRETGNQRNAAKIGAAKRRMNGVHNVGPSEPGSGSVESTSSRKPAELEGIERSQVNKQQTSSSQQVHDPSKGCYKEANQRSHDTVDDPSTEQTTAEVDIKLHNLHISPSQSVIFPNDFQLPEAFKNALTFGSLNASQEESNKDLNPLAASVSTNVEASNEPSPIPHSSPSISGHGDYSDRPQSPPNVLVLSSSARENASSGALRFDQSNEEMLQPVGESHKSLLPTMPDYGSSLIPPAVGSHLVQPEVPEPQGGNSLVTSKAGSTPSMTPPRGIAQSSTIPVSPHMLSYVRQPYPPNYIPYSPFFPQMYMSPQNAQHLLGAPLFPQQPSTGNIYMPPTAAASGVKFPVYKPGNPTHFGISSGYGPYGASGMGYGSSAALRQGTSSNDDDDIGRPDLKEKNMYSAIKQNGDLRSLTSASGRDTSVLPGNVLYNPPQGQHVAYSPSQVGHTGMYHPTAQSMSTLHHPQTVDHVVPPLGSYPQSQFQHQPHFLPQQYGR